MDKVKIKAEAIKRAIEKHESSYSNLHFNKEKIRRDWENYIEEPLNIALDFVLNQHNKKD